MAPGRVTHRGLHRPGHGRSGRHVGGQALKKIADEGVSRTGRILSGPARPRR